MSIINGLIVVTMIIVGIMLVIVPTMYPDKYTNAVERIIRYVYKGRIN